MKSIDEFSGSVLRTLGRWGGILEQSGFGAAPRKGANQSLLDSVSDLYQATAISHDTTTSAVPSWKRGVEIQNDLQRKLGNDHLIASPNLFHTSGFAKAGSFASVAGGVLDAVTGVGNVLVAVHRDQTHGDHSYRATIRESILSTVQISAGAAAGYGGAALAGALAFGAGSVAAPIVFGVGVGLAASYAVGWAADYLRSTW